MKPLVYYDFRKDDDCNIIIPEDRYICKWCWHCECNELQE